MRKLFVRHNEKGSISIKSYDEYLTLRINHVSQFGDTLSETEISLSPNDALHLQVPFHLDDADPEQADDPEECIRNVES